MSSGMANLNKLFLGAAERGDVVRAEEYLELGADLHATDNSMERNALHLACKEGHLPMAKFLIGAGLSAYEVDQTLDTPVHLAAVGNHPRMLHFLAEERAQFYVGNRSNMIPVWETLHAQKYDCFSAVLDIAGLEDEERFRTYSKIRKDVQNGTLTDLQILVEEYDKISDKIDTVDDGDKLKNYLLKQGKKWRTPFSSAAAWQRVPRILTEMEEAGVFVTKEELTEIRGDGKNLFQRAAECHKLRPLLEHLAKHGEALELSDVVDVENGEPTPLLQTAIDTCQIAGLMALAIEFSDDPHLPRQIVGACPTDELAWQVPNAHSLATQATRISSERMR